MQRLILFIGLGLCIHCQGQQSLYSKDPALVKDIGLPSRLPSKHTGNNTGNGAPYIYLLSDHDVYDWFGYDSMKQFNDFNFKDYHILGIYTCPQCQRNCDHESGKKACHRNRCMNEWQWVMRSNEKAFSSLPVEAVKDSLPYQRSHYWPADTLLQPGAMTGSQKIRWYTTGFGDCKGWFTYGLYKDNFHPVVLLKEFSHYGGCRAAGEKSTMLHFEPVAGTQYYRKNTIRLDHNE